MKIALGAEELVSRCLGQVDGGPTCICRAFHFLAERVSIHDRHKASMKHTRCEPSLLTAGLQLTVGRAKKEDKPS
jgi:hypothetical protein